MGYNQFDTPAVLARIRDIDQKYPGHLKQAAMVCALAQLNIGRQPRDFDPSAALPYVKYTGQVLPGTMTLAAIVYMLAQTAYNPHFLDAGIVTLAGGTATVLSASAAATRAILLSYYSIDGNGATVRYGTIVDGVSFVITSSNGADTNQVSWAILES